MKRAVVILLLFVLLIGGVLAGMRGCAAHRHERIMHRSISYAEENAQLLVACADDLLEQTPQLADHSDTGAATLMLNDDADSYRITQNSGAEMTLYNYRNETETIFQSAQCRAVFDGKTVERIMVMTDASQDHAVVRFSCASFGMGPSTAYYEIQYIPSDDVRELWAYDPHMTYSEKDGGQYGTYADSDNTFFYARIAEGLYYCEATF